MQAKALIRETYDPVPYIREKYRQVTLEPDKLGRFQKIIMITDGTLTKILEAYLNEELNVVKLAENTVPSARIILPLKINAGRNIIERKILLQGKTSRKNWLYAESFIVPDRLDDKFKEKLLVTGEPIGKLWLEYRMEIFKEIISSARETAGDLSEYFEIEAEDMLLCRTYRVFSGRKPIMMITEKFPECYFQ
ncbi:MAG: DUF98 domain-containing protein [Desulfobacteraceae bacterium]|nr:DUF98 domain-containing protein [Desulfobacteraceae bacterium]MCP4349112.1 DUF98 domain-containing protein [Desulfobacterales bacterium]